MTPRHRAKPAIPVHVRVALLWHMHQPSYRDPVHGAFVLPWVRLHALRDYLGMVRLLEATPGVHATFNLVPSLLDQVEAYARDEAREGELRVGLLPAAQLTLDERVFALRTLFLMSEPLMAPWPRLRALRDRHGPLLDESVLEARGGAAPARAENEAALRQAAAAFDEQDLRDLQVLSKLAWFDLDWLAHDPIVRALAEKGRGYDEDDKRRLRERELALLRSVLPAYREAAERGRIEIATSPYYHPILPLLADSDAHREAHPDAPLPRRFRHPEDALDQILRARARHAELFGRRPEGLWPSEGSVSDEVMELAARGGVRWLASDEGVLERSLGLSLERNGDGVLGRPELLYVPWVRRTAGGDVRILFRDRTLSDLIGFVYSRWRPEDAAADLLERVRAVGRQWAAARLPGVPLVPIILDGENAWEHFRDGGRVFLAAFYRGLQDDPALEAVTVAEALALTPAREMPRVFAGSWIGADFSVWIGHADDRRAWDALGLARDALAAAPDGLPPDAVARAWEAYRAAAGSDWCWWYGDDRSSANDLDFDRLFRRHLETVYRALEREPPADLQRSFITSRAVPVVDRAPAGPVAPTLDGRIAPADEWTDAGSYRAPQAGSMARGRGGIRGVRFGVGGGFLHLLVETAGSAGTLLASGEVRVDFGAPPALRYRLLARDGGTSVRCERLGEGWQPVPTAARAVAAEVLEAAIPWPEVATGPGPVAFAVGVWQSGAELERHPDGAPIEVRGVEDGREERDRA
jgi:alpha-amylase/alpha-mannosidase (GH57 family)